MLLPRILTALVLIPLIMIALFADNVWGWRILVTAFITVAWWEWLNMANARALTGKTVALSLLLPAVSYVMWISAMPLVMVWLVAVVWLLLIAATLRTQWQSSFIWHDTSKLLSGVLTLGFAWSSLVWFKEQVNGPWWIIGFLLIIWLADTGAYFAGKRFGKTKLAPAVSPGKTLEGMLGGLLLVGAYVLVLILSLPQVPLNYLAILAAILIAVISVGGDLYESWLKRQAGIKDSGHILPGHGGVLDRIDSLIAALPFMVLTYFWLN